MNTPTLSYAEFQFFLQQDFVSFIERSFYELNPTSPLLLAPYIEIMAAKLEACRQGKIKRLIITLPPRYLKSHCASIAFVAWLLGHQPATQIICASYGQDLADKLALDTRKILACQWYQSLFSTRLATDKQAVNDFMTTDSGFRMATSVGGVLTGRGADFIIIDDPLKPEDGFSATKRAAVNNWYDGTLLSRLNNKTTGCIILIMQRLHQDDLVGHVLGQDDWEVVSFPALAEADEHYMVETVLGTKTFVRREGEPLHAERESLAMLKATRERIGSYFFSSQYQQNPIPVEGSFVKHDWLQYYDATLPLPAGTTYTLQSWDTANKSNELNDYSVCTTWRVIDDRYYLLHVFRHRLEYPDLKRKVKELATQYKPHAVLIEDKASGTALIQELQAERFAKILPYLPPSGTDKLMRLVSQTDLFENGQIFLPLQAPWLHDYRQELTSFPGTKFDDQVDSTTQALAHLRENGNHALRVWALLGKS
ncbi:MAG: phage terminase large subunit [Burkholderiaceae bacterium]